MMNFVYFQNFLSQHSQSQPRSIESSHLCKQDKLLKFLMFITPSLDLSFYREADAAF